MENEIHPAFDSNNKGGARHVKRGARILSALYASSAICAGLDKRSSLPFISSGPVRLADFGSFQELLDRVRTNLQGQSTKTVARGTKAASSDLDVTLTESIFGVVVTVANIDGFAAPTGVKVALDFTGASDLMVEVCPVLNSEYNPISYQFIALAVANNQGRGQPSKATSVVATLTDTAVGVVDTKTSLVLESLNLWDLDS